MASALGFWSVFTYGLLSGHRQKMKEPQNDRSSHKKRPRALCAQLSPVPKGEGG